MKPTLATTLAVIVVTAAVSVAVGGAKFYPPDGWSVTKRPDGTTLVQPPGVPADRTCAVVIMPDVAGGDVNGVFATSWRTLTAEMTVVTGGEPRARWSDGNLDTRSTTATVDAAGSPRSYMYFFSVQAGPDVRRVLFVSDDRALFDEHLPAVRAMLDAAGTDPGARAANRRAPATATAGFAGTFYRAGAGFDPTGAPGEAVARVDYLCLAPDGRAYNGHPTGGPAACFEDEDPRSSSYGRYTIDGDEVVITWNHDRVLGRQHAQVLRRRPDGTLDEGGATYRRLDPCDGLRLDGTFARTWADGSSTTIRFTPGGRFTEQGLKDCVNLDQLARPDWPKLPPAGSGTYAIGGNTLDVTYDRGGPTRRMFFHTPDDPANPAGINRISIASHALERRP